MTVNRKLISTKTNGVETQLPCEKGDKDRRFEFNHAYMIKIPIKNS